MEKDIFLDWLATCRQEQMDGIASDGDFGNRNADRQRLPR